jgi:Flp pilus assembly protein CpaB
VALPLSAPLAAGFAAPGSRVDVVFPDPKARVAIEGAKVLALDSTTANGKTVHTVTVELTAKQAEAVAPLLRAKAEPLVWARELLTDKGKPLAALPKGCTLIGLELKEAAGFVAPGSRVDVLAREGRRVKTAFESLTVFAVNSESTGPTTYALAVPLADAERAAQLVRDPAALALVLKKPEK